MITKSHPGFISGRQARAGAILAVVLGLLCGSNAGAVTSTTTLADAPIFATSNVPGNMVFTPSVEFPTAISVANLGSYADGTVYLGYFDPAKCYTYVYNAAPEAGSSLAGSSSYFQPAALASGTNSHSCSGQWSGNFMNWAAMQTIDPFRWALTGGYRAVDQTAYPQTIIEKAWGSNQGGTNNFPYRGTDQTSGNTVSPSLVSLLTPFSAWTHFNSAIWSNGNMMAFSGDTGSFEGTGAAYNLTDLTNDVSTPNGKPGAGYRVYIRVSVCDTKALGTPGLESNCVSYGSGVNKPQGLIQQYSNQIKYSVIGYLNTANQAVQGGVLREPMEFVGPTYPQPLSNSVVTNPNAEWSSANGIMSSNPDATTANASNGGSVSQSGVMNYLNKFGEYGASQSNYTNTYMTYDHVGEMYYAAIRYYENLGNVPQWLPNTAYGTVKTQLDGFPAVTTWKDPISYYCQNNFILGIGDDHTWEDYNVGGSTQTGQNIGGHSPAPSAVTTGDTFNQANSWLFALQNLEGITQTPWWPFDSGATYYIAGLAYGTHVNDIRPDLGVTTNGTKTISTISTYWMDVAEDQEVENLNPYYLATKYGGFTVPSGYSISNTTPLTLGEYDTTGNNIVMNGNQTHPLPDNYFETGNASTMVASLKLAFSNIAIAITPHTTSFSLSSPIVASSGAMSFASQYASNNWTSVITASTVTFPGGTPTFSNVWLSSSTLQGQLAGTGWQAPFTGSGSPAKGRNIVTWSGTAGVPFEVSSITAAQTSALTLGSSSYSPTTTVAQYLSYLRGDTTNQVGSTVAGSTKSLRARTLFLGDIVDAGLTPVSTPISPFAEGTNPGYTSFQTTWGSRMTMVYAAANDGMLHGFIGASGLEQFAYIPSAVFQGPNNTPLVNGLAALGNPNFAHHYYVDATPGVFDVDLNRTNGQTDTASTSNWHTLLIGGLGKGGTSYYALDVTNPAAMTSETAAAGKVLWEFTDPTMGYSYGTPVVVKTAQYGWVVIFTSGYDNADGYGYLYIVNPATGLLLQPPIKTPLPSNGLAQASAFVENYTDSTADSVYVGDLNGQLWRFNLTATSGNYPAPIQIALLTDGSGNVQPISSAPDIEIHPTTRERYVLVGTGELLSTGDIGSSQVQTFYAIIDGTGGGFGAISTPIVRANLVAVTDVTAGIGTIPPGKQGWYYDLPARYRITTMPVSYNGIASFAALIPTTDPCSPQGSSNVYAVNYSTGQSVLNPAVGSISPAADVSFPTGITNLKVALTGATIAANGVATGGAPELIACTSTGSCSQVGVNLIGTLSTRILNWREIPTAQ